MPSQGPSRTQSPLADASTLYETIQNFAQSGHSQTLGTSLTDIDGRLLQAVSANLNAPLDAIRKDLDEALQTIKDIGNDASTISTTAVKEVASMPERLKVDTISAIPTRVKMLLANFQNAVEDPRSLYPRLICCDAPVDPAQVVNFTKRHQLLDQLLQERGDDKSNRSMPSAPKSALDVITNVNSSLESISDMLCESIDRVVGISNNFESINVSAKNLASINGPVAEAMNHFEETRGLFQRVTAMFDQDKDSSVSSRDIGEAQNAMQVVMKASEVLKNFDSTCLPVDVLPQLQNARGVLSKFAQDFTALLSRAEEALSSLISVLRKFVDGLPRIVQELRHFFVPAGLKALVMKPSSDLMSLLQSVDDLRVILPEPGAIEESVSKTLGANGLDRKMLDLGDTFQLLDKVQEKLIKSIKNQNLQAIISETVLETLKSILQDLNRSVSDILDVGKDGIDPTAVVGTLGEFLGFSEQQRGSKPEKQGQRPVELVENVISAGGLFGKLFGA